MIALDHALTLSLRETEMTPEPSAPHVESSRVTIHILGCIVVAAIYLSYCTPALVTSLNLFWIHMNRDQEAVNIVIRVLVYLSPSLAEASSGDW